MNEAPEMKPLPFASVKVMRSYDYCHFEIQLSTTGPCTQAEVDALRKEAARLADKAVAQYQIAKENVERELNDRSYLDALRYRHRDALKKPEGERTPEEKALVKAIADRAHFNRRRYNYEDDWDEEPDYKDGDEIF